MLHEELNKVDVALFQVREVAPGKAADTGRGQHAEDHFDGVIAGVEQRDGAGSRRECIGSRERTIATGALS